MKKAFKRLTRILVVALCLSFVQIPASFPVSPVREAKAAAAPVVKIRKRAVNGEYDYYGVVNGKKLINKWGRYIDAKSGKTYWLYFGGKYGKAIKAYATPFSAVYKERFVTKSIKTKTSNGIVSRTYGFDQFGRRISGIWFSTDTNKLYYFASNGIYNASRTSTLRKATVKGKVVTRNSLQNLFGRCKKRQEKAGGCFDIGSPMDDGSRLVYYTFDHIQIVTSKTTPKAPEKFYLIDALFK